MRQKVPHQKEGTGDMLPEMLHGKKEEEKQGSLSPQGEAEKAGMGRRMERMQALRRQLPFRRQGRPHMPFLQKAHCRVSEKQGKKMLELRKGIHTLQSNHRQMGNPSGGQVFLLHRVHR